MFALLPGDERRTQRTELASNQITGLLIDRRESSRQSFLLRNISATGIGLWTGNILVADSTVKIILGDPYGGLSIECQVNWSEVDAAGGYNSGLKIISGG